MARSKKTNGKTGKPRAAAPVSSVSDSVSDITENPTTPGAASAGGTATDGARMDQGPATPTAKQTKRRPPSRMGPTGKPLETPAEVTETPASQPVAGAMPKVKRSRKATAGAAASDTPSDGASSDDASPDNNASDPTSEPQTGGSDGPPPAVYPTPATQPEPQPRRGGFFPMVLGGLVAGLIGYGAAQYVGPDGWPFGRQATDTGATTGQDTQAQLDALRAEVEAATQRSTALEAEVTSLGGKVSDGTAPLVDRIDALQIATEDTDERLAALEDRPEPQAEVAPATQKALTDLGSRLDEGLATVNDTLAATRNDQEALRGTVTELAGRVDALESGLESRLSEVSEVRESAEAAESRARRQAALADIQAALTSGAPYQEPVSTLGAESTDEIPQALTAAAPDGVPTLAELQDRFPDAARDALGSSIKATAGSDPVSRFGAFLRTQTGARSLSARDGDDPDAVLSRAQDAMNQGQLETALAELEALPEEGRAAMSDWLTDAEGRLAVVNAFDDYSASLTQN